MSVDRRGGGLQGASVRGRAARRSRAVAERLEPRVVFSVVGGAEALEVACGGCAGGLTNLSIPATPRAEESSFVRLRRRSGVEALWRPSKRVPAVADVEQGVYATSLAPFRFDAGALSRRLSLAPLEGAGAGLLLRLPGPDGAFHRFRVFRSDVMDPALAAKVPGVTAYSVRGVDEPAATGRLDISPQGLRATVLGSALGTWYIDPLYHLRATDHVAYRRADARMAPSLLADALAAPPDRHEHGHDEHDEHDGAARDASANEEETGEPAAPLPPSPASITSGTQLRTYRLAMAATGEYTGYWGGTIPGAMAAIASVVNRVNALFERDLSVRLTLVAGNDLLVYTNAATDPFATPDSASSMLTPNQTNTDAVIGSVNYDVGHVLHKLPSSSSGLAFLSVVGTVSKARGYSAHSVPSGDPFSVDYVAHELGHQFGARHTFSNCSSSNPTGGSNAFPVEPGSGSTVMSYAGICVNNLQGNSDAMFHSASVEQITTFLDTVVPFVGTRTTPVNTPPTVSAGPDFNLPANTPYTLTAAASDPDADPLTYSWEQRDQFTPGVQAPPPVNNTGSYGASVRVFLPVASPSRSVPAYADVLNNTATNGVRLSSVARQLNFTVAVRDGRGGYASDDLLLNVVDSPGFALTFPNTAGHTVVAGGSTTVTWNTAGTDLAPVSTASVRLLLSTDGGATFPTVVATVPNTGSASVVFPTNVTTTSLARLRVEPVGNIYYDLSDSSFTLVSLPPGPGAPQLAAATDTGVSSSDAITSRNNRNNGARLTFTVPGVTAGATVQLRAGSTLLASGVASTTSISLTTNGTFTLPDGTNAFTAVQVLNGLTSAASGALAVVIDTTAPTLTSPALGVTAAVRNSPLASASASFSEAVSGLAAANFSLSRDGANVSLSGSSVSGSGSSFTFGPLTSATSPTANYVLSMSASGVTDLAGNALASGTSAAFSVNVVTLAPQTFGENVVRLATDAADPSLLRVFVNDLTNPLYTWTFTPGQRLRLQGSSGADRLQFIGSTGQAYNADIEFRPGGGGDSVAVFAGTFVTNFDLGPAVDVRAFSNARIRFGVRQTLAGLTLDPGATVAASGGLVLSGLAIANDAGPAASRAYLALLDLERSNLIVRNGDFNTLRSMARSWWADGTRTGGGIGSSFSGLAGRDALATVAVRSNVRFGFREFPTFAGTNVEAGDVLLKYTYRGDLDLDGRVDATEGARVVNGWSNARTTWEEGDSDHDGLVNASDYATALTALSTQGAPFA